MKENRHPLDKNRKQLTAIHLPLYCYFESELLTLQRVFMSKGDEAGLALLEPELHRRKMETVRVKELTFRTI